MNTLQEKKECSLRPRSCRAAFENAALYALTCGPVTLRCSNRARQGAACVGRSGRRPEVVKEGRISVLHCAIRRGPDILVPPETTCEEHIYGQDFEPADVQQAIIGHLAAVGNASTAPAGHSFALRSDRSGVLSHPQTPLGNERCLIRWPIQVILRSPAVHSGNAGLDVQKVNRLR